MAMNAALEAALKSAAPLVCLLLQIELPDHTIRIIDGVGQVVFNGHTFNSKDPIYGTLSAVEDTSEQIGVEAPKMRMVLLPESETAMAKLVHPTAQGSPVSLWFGAIDQITGHLIGEPELVFAGELDTADIDASEETTVIWFEVSSIWERLFDDNEGHRWNDSFWTYLYGSNARAFQHVTNAGKKLFWGYNGPSSGSGGSYGGGNGSIGGGPGSGFEQAVK
ncbi:hypothetical protein HMPREF0185_00190 [Brevundimonas diminuta 470-4]|nr:hypothetical protein HMPREF0185_00190 [Brevundimonas diminuta 470-4]